MPKYRITLEQQKEKVIRASSLEIATKRAENMATGFWILTEVEQVQE